MSHNSPNAFRRSAMMAAQIGAIIAATGVSDQLKRLQIEALGTYQSRGKGGGHAPQRARHGKHMDGVRKAAALRNKAKRK